MINKAMFSSTRTNWQTPQNLLINLRAEFGELFDPCPLNPSFDGLKIDWAKRNFVNPPYGREIGKWCKKAFEESQKGKLVIMLVPSRTDTKWWHDYLMQADEIRFIRGRLKFDDQKHSAPFPSAVIIFNGKQHSDI